MDSQLYNALIHKKIDYIVKHIKDIGDINAKDPCSGTIMSVAVGWKMFELIQPLIDAGYNINKMDHNLYPIHVVVQNYPIKYMNILVENGADINIISSQGQTPLIYAANYILYNSESYGLSNSNSFKTMLRLIKLGCNLRIKDNNGKHFKYYLYESDFFHKNYKMVRRELHKALKINYSRSSLLDICVYHIKYNLQFYQDQLRFLIWDLRKIFRLYI